MPEELRFISRKLAPTFFSGSATLWGLIEAGAPSPAEGEPLEHLALDEYLIAHKEATYLVLVKGSSMQAAGILRVVCGWVHRDTLSEIAYGLRSLSSEPGKRGFSWCLSRPEFGAEKS